MAELENPVQQIYDEYDFEDVDPESAQTAANVIDHQLGEMIQIASAYGVPPEELGKYVQRMARQEYERRDITDNDLNYP